MSFRLTALGLGADCRHPTARHRGLKPQLFLSSRYPVAFRGAAIINGSANAGRLATYDGYRSLPFIEALACAPSEST